METLLRIGLANAACAAVLAMLAWGVSRLVRRPAVSHALWVLVLLKLITPPVWNVPVVLPSPPPTAMPPRMDPAEFARQDHPLAAPRAMPMAHAVSEQRDWPHLLLVSLCGIWLTGSLACVLVTFIRLRRFATVLGYAKPVPCNVQAHANQIGRELGFGRVPGVWFLPGPVCPMLWAAFGRSRLLLPGDLWDRLAPAQQSSLLAHELAHLRRRDHLVRMLELIVTLLFWWDPVLWWARHELHIEEESCCDAWVAWALPDNTHDYASAIVEAIDFASARSSIPSLASGVGDFRSLKRRLLMIQQGNSAHTCGNFGTILVCTAALLLPLAPGQAQTRQHSHGDPKAAQPSVAASQPSTKAADEHVPGKELAKRLALTLPEVRITGVGLADVIDFMHDVTGIQIAVDWNALDAIGVHRTTPMTMAAQNISAKSTLDRLVAGVIPKPGNSIVIWFPDKSVVRITTADRGQRVQRILNQSMPDVTLDAVGFSDVIDYLRDVSRADIFVDWKALEVGGIDRNTPVSARIRRATLSKGLEVILGEVGQGRAKLDYTVDEGVITISTVDQLSKDTVVQVYDVRDLAGKDDARGDKLISTIIDSIDPKSWNVHGGHSGAIRELQGQLIVTQTPINHRAIVKLLGNLRALIRPAAAPEKKLPLLTPGAP